MMDYNVPLGKLNRGMAVLDVVRSLAEARGQQLSEEEVFRAQALGWCIEFLQARRGPGWGEAPVRTLPAAELLFLLGGQMQA